MVALLVDDVKRGRDRREGEARRTLDAAASAQAAVFGAQAGLRGTLRLGMMQVISVVDIEVPDASIHTSLVCAGLGLAIRPESMIVAAGLAGVPLRPNATFTVAFIVAADRPLSPVTQAFADLVTTMHQS